ncbi:hypothetical protein DOTSEDRAFT_78301 [Lecanosticta acicola]|uniref:Uncharacterized protein n=1 Tax=Lecanosticta acicola TaxID=111012 RepID=A0AAI8YTH1_9PEZI|nr:hypothetical protein DOTSEDRAFT_78301 [Lecanosticta acicola]
MNRGNIPGYYYDEAKGKYFKIQANHAAPPQAKYSRYHVEREQRETKKRKLEQERDAIVKKQTVPAANLLKHPLLGRSGLQREHGDRPHAFDRRHRDSAFVQGLEPNNIDISLTGFLDNTFRISDTHYLSETSQQLFAISHGPASHAIYCHDRKDWSQKQTLPQRPASYAFHEAITVLVPVSFQDTTYAVACTSTPNDFSGNVFVGALPLPGQDPRDADSSPSGCFFNVGKAGDELWDCKLNTNGNAAFVGSFGAVVRHISDLPNGTTFAGHNGSMEAFACDWLDCNTLAIGTRAQSRKRFFHGVQLWDVRTEDSAERFKRDGKGRVVAIKTPNPHGTNLLVASTQEIDLYDTRMGQGPLMSIKHSSGSTRLHLSTHGNLLAAPDQYNQIQVYSLASGQPLRSFGSQVPYLLQKPRWQEDARGTLYLQACAKNTIWQWEW